MARMISPYYAKDEAVADFVWSACRWFVGLFAGAGLLYVFCGD